MKPIPKAVYISHGGGPMPLLGDAGHQEMVACLEQIAASIPKPDAIVVVSAHWEESIPTVTSAAAPELIYDYYGFPPESYEIQYPCPGEPALARELAGALESSKLPVKLDQSRGLDHGVFVPLKIMYPEADIPTVQLSLLASLDPATNMEMGAALAGLHRENVLILGSGFSFHNLKAFFQSPTSQHLDNNRNFESWLSRVVSDPALEESERRQLLMDWSAAPGARYCHPREEHLLPLHVCYGVAQGPCSEQYQLQVHNAACSMTIW